MANIDVIYKYIDGAHFFVSDDKTALGLCVASKDLSVAYREVGEQLNLLFKHNHGKTTDFAPALPVEQFAKIVQASLEAKDHYDIEDNIVPSFIQQWMLEKHKAGSHKS